MCANQVFFFYNTETESGKWLFNQYSYSETIATPGLAIRCDTNTNACEDTAF